ncbi:MAG: M48 family metalloprotease [Chloroflexaceae bacterium]|nr:M48 family metalloprotease [Chloroflexaceae bacterium]
MSTNPQTFQTFFRRCSALATLFCFSLPISGASALRSPNVTTISLQPANETTLALNPFDLLRGAIRYIQVANISDRQEVEIGQQINQRLLQRQYQLYTNPQVNRYVDSIGQRLVASSDSRDIPYTFQVVRSDTINAFATPGGFVYVTTGLLRAADNEAQLASVLAHEIAHINERHSIEALKRAAIAQGIAETAGVETNTLANLGYQLAVDLPRTRGNEYEADRVGLEILTAAGYPPRASVQFLEQLQGMSRRPEFLRTHPTTANRIEALSANLEATATSAPAGLSASAYQRQISPLL